MEIKSGQHLAKIPIGVHFFHLESHFGHFGPGAIFHLLSHFPGIFASGRFPVLFVVASIATVSNIFDQGSRWQKAHARYLNPRLENQFGQLHRRNSPQTPPNRLKNSTPTSELPLQQEIEEIPAPKKQTKYCPTCKNYLNNYFRV